MTGRRATGSATSDVVVVGGGVAGLVAGALLARAGRRVVVCEHHALPGGCASWFTADRFRFDVGATTLSGLRPGEPIARLLAELELDVVLERSDPGVAFHDERGVVRRFGEPGRWQEEAARAFAGDGDAPGFFAAAEALADRAWRAAPQLAAFPPTRVRDLAAWLAPRRWGALALLPALRRPVARELGRHGIAAGSRAGRFVAEQLAITTQRSPEETPWLFGAMGLAYPRDTWSVVGGLGAFAQALARALRRFGGELRLQSRVVGLERHAAGGVRWVATLADGTALAARDVLFAAPLGALGAACPELAGWAARRTAGAVHVGAFTLYAGIDVDFDDHGTPFHQVALPEPLPLVGGRSLFLSFSRAGEAGRAPPGARALTVSTHVAAPAEWASGRHADDRAAVDLVALALRRGVERAFPALARAAWRPFLPGTPRTFLRYTLRPDGAVGGIGHGLALPPWRCAGARAPLDGLYLAGDTVFPGQGTPAVARSARAAVDALLADGARRGA